MSPKAGRYKTIIIQSFTHPHTYNYKNTFNIRSVVVLIMLGRNPSIPKAYELDSDFEVLIISLGVTGLK